MRRAAEFIDISAREYPFVGTEQFYESMCPAMSAGSVDLSAHIVADGGSASQVRGIHR
jgi:hypothetical protein